MVDRNTSLHTAMTPPIWEVVVIMIPTTDQRLAVFGRQFRGLAA